MNKETEAYPYFDMYSKDGSDISFERWTDSRSVGMHRHRYYELLFVGHGSCRHMYNSTETLLIPGDAVIVSKHQAHGFSLSGETIIYNCQFLLDTLDPYVVQELREHESLLDVADLSRYEDVRVWETLLHDREKEAYYQKEQLHVGYELNSSKQGVIHLSPVEFSFVNSVLQHGIDEQDDLEKFGPLIKRKYLEIILLELKKALSRQNQKYRVCSKSNQKAIAAVLMDIEDHLDETLDFNAVAQHYSFSPNYFRKIFKDITGFSPVVYVNRLRIVRACQYMQEENMSIRDAAERVGISDLNYFSRLFKKFMGCTPSKMQNNL